MTMTQDIPESIRKSPAEMYREWRTMRYQVKQLGKQLGKAGATIHQQRGTIAALRQAVAITPGDLERYFASSDDLRAVNHQLRAEVERLREKLAGQDA